MSKRIAYVPEIHIEGPNEDKLYKVPGTDAVTTVEFSRSMGQDGKIVETPNPRWVKRQRAFLLERICDPAFIDGKDGIDGEILRDTARGVIKAQAVDAEKRGYWEFDDETARRLVNATMQPKTPHPTPQLAFNEVPFIKAVRDNTTPAEIELPAVTNGAHAQA